jgi:ZIP family zinc transporter
LSQNRISVTGIRILTGWLVTVIITLIFVVLGAIISQLTDNFINTKFNNNNLYKLGIISIIALILHNIPEGITTYLTTSTNYKLGLKLSLAIALHNIPEGISIAIPLFYSTKNRKKAFLLTLISGLSEAFGTLLAFLFIKEVNNLVMSFILAITAGIMIHLSIYELYPNIKLYKNKKITYLYTLLGIIVILICHYIL